MKQICVALYEWFWGKPYGLSSRAPRSPLWAKARLEHLKREPVCQWSGSKFDLEVHHILPFHLKPELELDPNNMITLSGRSNHIFARALRAIIGNENCHLIHGHFGNYQNYNPDIRAQCDARKALLAA